MGVDQSEYLEKLLSIPAQDIVELDLGFGIAVDGIVITRSTFDAIKI